MLVNQLKSKLPLNWEELFKHHESYPEDYYDVAELEIDGAKKILVLNRNTMDLMEYYYDDIPNDQWINLEPFFKVRKNFQNIINLTNDEYYINKKYEILCAKTNKLRKLKSSIGIRDSYPRIVFSLNRKPIKSMVHIIIATIFNPNADPKNNIIVNHIDNDSKNFKKENLEWCTPSYNSKKENKIATNKDSIIYQQIDINGNIVKEWESREELIKYYPYYSNGLNNGKLYKGYYWKIIYKTLKNYKSRHPVVEDGWYTNPFITSHKVEANLCGILRIDGKETVGTLNKNTLTYNISINNTRYLVHRLIYETITRKKIESEKVIDHIQPIRSIETINNEFFNLREVSQKENMNNIETKKFLGNSCEKYDLFGNYLKEYYSISEALSNEDSNCIKDSINGRILTTEGKYLWCFSSNRDKIEHDIQYIYYRFNKNKLIEDASVNLIRILSNYPKEGTLEDKRKFYKNKTIKLIKEKYINTGMPAPDGYYYQQGDPDNMIYDPSNTNYVRKKEIVNFTNRIN